LGIPGTHPNLAAALLRAVHDHRPDDFWVNYTLGQLYAKTSPPRTDEQIRFLTAALAVRPDVPGVYTMLGCALWAQGREAEAMTAFRRAIALNRHCFGAWQMLTRYATPAERTRHRDELEQLARDHPADVHFQRELGTLYYGQRQYDRAAEQFRRLAELTPGDWQPRANLGLCLEHLGRPEEAAAAFQEAVRLAPDRADLLNRLCPLLRRSGAAGEELRVFKEWYDRLPADYPRRESATTTLKYLERLADLERRLPDFRGGRAEPASAGEAVMLARLCQGKKLYPDAVRFYATAFERNPAQAEHPQTVDRYNAACAAARAAAEPGPADVRAAYRKQALDWLRADLAARAARAKTAEERAAARQFLRETVRPDPDLAGVRSPWYLAVLPAGERTEWVKLWAEVDALEKSLAPPEVAPRPRPVH
jgi:Flp pilus assembly protein TadD